MFITSEHLIRDYNLYQLSGIKMNKYTIDICDWLDIILKDLKKFRTVKKKFHNFIIYGSSETKLLIEYDTIDKKILVDYNNFYKPFNKYFIFDMSDINIFISMYIASKLKIEDDIYHNGLSWLDSIGIVYGGDSQRTTLEIEEIKL